MKFYDHDPEDEGFRNALEAARAKKDAAAKQNQVGGITFEGALFNPSLENDRLQMYMYDAIDSWFGLAAVGMVECFREYPDVPVDLYINCPGGEVYEGRAMRSLVERRGNVTAHTDGMCASAATTIALGCENHVMGQGTQFMVHQCWGLGTGNKQAFRSMADEMEKVDNDIAGDYAKASGKPRDEMLTLMEGPNGGDGTILSADEARGYGFCDSMEQPEEPEKPEPKRAEKPSEADLFDFLSRNRAYAL